MSKNLKKCRSLPYFFVHTMDKYTIEFLISKKFFRSPSQLYKQSINVNHMTTKKCFIFFGFRKKNRGMDFKTYNSVLLKTQENKIFFCLSCLVDLFCYN